MSASIYLRRAALHPSASKSVFSSSQSRAFLWFSGRGSTSSSSDTKLDVEPPVPVASTSHSADVRDGESHDITSSTQNASSHESSSGQSASVQEPPAVLDSISRMLKPQKVAGGETIDVLQSMNSRLLEKVSERREHVQHEDTHVTETPKTGHVRALPHILSLPGYPSPWLSDLEVKRILWPLYQRWWYVSAEPLPNGQERNFHTLKKVFKFKKRVWAAIFMKEVADTMIRLRHDAFLFLDARTVVVETYTHDALAPLRRARYEHPGITRHDVNLAVEIEKIWKEHCDDDQVEMADMMSLETISGRTGERQMQVASLGHAARRAGFIKPLGSAREEPRSQKCPECGEPHALRDCPKYALSGKPGVCSICGGDHWTTEHPKTCPACKGPHGIQDCPDRHKRKPPHPCTNCQEWHWAVDCPMGTWAEASARRLDRQSGPPQKASRS